MAEDWAVKDVRRLTRATVVMRDDSTLVAVDALELAEALREARREGERRGAWQALRWPEGNDLENAAASIHVAYLSTCERLGWTVKPENRVPYASLSEEAKELDRESVRAVVGYLRGIDPRSVGRALPLGEEPGS